MKSIEERVALLEGRMTEQSEMFADIRATLVRLEDRIDARFDHVDARFAKVDDRFNLIDARFDKVDERFNLVDARFDRVDERFNQVDARFDRVDARFDGIDDHLGRMDDRFGRVESRMATDFRWLAGLQVTTLLAVVIALIGVAFR